MTSILKAFFACCAVVTLLTACHKKEEAAPPPPAATLEKTPSEAPPAPAAEAAAPTPANTYDGEWSGNSGEDLPISFTIMNNQVTSLQPSYAGRNGSCSFNGSFGSSESAAIEGNSFTSKGNSSHEVLEFVAKGNLNSPTEASGTLVWKGKSDLCGDINLSYQWTAKKNPAETIEE